MKKYMVWLISALMALSMTACSNAQKKDTKDQAQITTAAKENATQTEAAKTTSKKEKKNERKKDKKKSQKSKKNSKKTKNSTAKKKETSTTTAKKKKVKKKKTKEKTTKTKNTKETTKTTTASKNESTVQTAENQTTEAKQEQSCEFLISCKTVLSNKSALQSNYQVPAGGKIYEKKMEFQEGDTVMDVLKRTGVDIDVSKGYVAGIIKQWLDNNIRTYDDLKAYEIGVKNRRDESGEYSQYKYANTNERENEKYTRKPTDEEIEELRKSYENMRRDRGKL